VQTPQQDEDPPALSRTSTSSALSPDSAVPGSGAQSPPNILANPRRAAPPRRRAAKSPAPATSSDAAAPPTEPASLATAPESEVSEPAAKTSTDAAAAEPTEAPTAQPESHAEPTPVQEVAETVSHDSEPTATVGQHDQKATEEGPASTGEVAHKDIPREDASDVAEPAPAESAPPAANAEGDHEDQHEGEHAVPPSQSMVDHESALAPSAAEVEHDSAPTPSTAAAEPAVIPPSTASDEPKVVTASTAPVESEIAPLSAAPIEPEVGPVSHAPDALSTSPSEPKGIPASQVTEPKPEPELEVEAQPQPTAEPEEEEDEAARRKRIAERLAKMGGVNPFGGPRPVVSPSASRSNSTNVLSEPAAPQVASEDPKPVETSPIAPAPPAVTASEDEEGVHGK
jgi:hypothetical protein